MSLKMFSFHLDPNDINKAREISIKENRSLAWVIRKIINFGVNNWKNISADRF
jgi:hypothetical protein